MWWAKNPAQGFDNVPEVTVAEIANPEIETGVIEGKPEEEEDDFDLFQRPILRVEGRVEDCSEADDEEDEFGLFQRPISRLENRREDPPEVDVTELGSSDSDFDTFHDAPEPDIFHDASGTSESVPPASGNIDQVQGSSRENAGIAGTDTERSELDGDGSEAVGLAGEDDRSSAQQADPVERPLSRAQKIIESQPALTPDEIDGYDTEEEEL